MTKIQRASIYLFLLFAGIGLEFELVIFLNKNLASLQAETWS